MTKEGEIALIRRGSSALARPMDRLEDVVQPATDIYETIDTFVLSVDMPGVKKESISVHIEPNKLHVNGIQAQPHKSDAHVVYSEMRKANYYRAFNVGNGVDPENIDATFHDGVLTLILHKNESMKAREIPIR